MDEQEKKGKPHDIPDSGTAGHLFNAAYIRQRESFSLACSSLIGGMLL